MICAILHRLKQFIRCHPASVVTYSHTTVRRINGEKKSGYLKHLHLCCYPLYRRQRIQTCIPWNALNSSGYWHPDDSHSSLAFYHSVVIVTILYNSTYSRKCQETSVSKKKQFIKYCKCSIYYITFCRICLFPRNKISKFTIENSRNFLIDFCFKFSIKRQNLTLHQL